MHNNLRYMEWCVQEDLNKIDDWFKANKLTLNASKSNCIIFHKKKTAVTNLTLQINKVTLPVVRSTKFLGVWVDDCLDCSEHLNKLVLKLKRNLNLLKVSKKLLTSNVKLTIYYAHFYSNLKYGISIWGHMASNAQLNKLQKIQDDCIRLVLSTKNINDSLYKKLGVLQINKVIQLESSKMMYKSLRGELPQVLTEALRTDSNHQSLNKKHNYSTRNKHVPKIP